MTPLHVRVFACFVSSLACFALASTVRAQERAAGYSSSNLAVMDGKRHWDYDGQRILGAIDRDAYVWDARTGQQLQRLTGHGERIFSVRFSPDGEHAMTTAWFPGNELGIQPKEISVRLWDLASGRELHRFENQVGGAFTPDGGGVLTFSTSQFQVALWDTASGDRRFLVSVSDRVFPVEGAANTELRFSPDGSEFLYSGVSNVVVWETETGREIGHVERLGVHTTAFHRLPRHIATFGPFQNPLPRFDADGGPTPLPDNGIDVWNVQTRERIRRQPVVATNTRPFPTVWFAVWTPDGTRIVAFDGVRKDVRVWDAESGNVIGSSTCDRCGIATPRVSPDGKRFLVDWMPEHEQEHIDHTVAGQNLPGGVGLFDATNGRLIAQIDLAPWGHLIGFSRDSKTFLVGGSPFVIYSSATGAPERQFDLLPAPVTSDRW